MDLLGHCISEGELAGVMPSYSDDGTVWALPSMSMDASSLVDSKEGHFCDVSMQACIIALLWILFMQASHLIARL